MPYNKSFFAHNAHDHTSLEQKPQYSKDLLDLDITKVVEEKLQKCLPQILHKRVKTHKPLAMYLRYKDCHRITNLDLTLLPNKPL
jgi:hypothetical protein